MSSVKAKEIRSQIRAVVKENFQALFDQEVKEQMFKELLPAVKETLEKVQVEVLAATTERLKEAKVNEHNLLRHASELIQDSNLTLLAWQALLIDKLAAAAIVSTVESFQKEILNKKAEIKARLEGKKQPE